MAEDRTASTIFYLMNVGITVFALFLSLAIIRYFAGITCDIAVFTLLFWSLFLLSRILSVLSEIAEKLNVG